jgi:hypothetical protein
MVRVAAILGVVLAGALGARAAQAEVPRRTSALSWTRLAGAESCIAPRELARSVEQRLGRSVFVSAAHADVTVEGTAEPAASGFRATIRLLDGDGETLGTRQLETGDASCAALSAPLALAMALMIDPEASAPAPPPRPRPAPLAAPGRDAPSATAAERPASYSMRLETGPAFSVGLLPREAAAGAALRWTADVAGWPAVQLSAAYWPPLGERGSGYWLLYGGLAVCPLTVDAIVRLESCAGMALGRVAVGSGREDVAGHPFLEARLGRRLVGPVAATLGATAAFPLNHRGYKIIGGSAPSHVAGIADIGIGIEVP